MIMRFFAILIYGVTMTRVDIFLPFFLTIVRDIIIKCCLFIKFYTKYFSVSLLSTYTVICNNQQMTFVSITFQKLVLKPFKQGIWCLLKGCARITHVIGNHVQGIFIRIIGNINQAGTCNPATLEAEFRMVWVQ